MVYENSEMIEMFIIVKSPTFTQLFPLLFTMNFKAKQK